MRSGWEAILPSYTTMASMFASLDRAILLLRGCERQKDISQPPEMQLKLLIVSREITSTRCTEISEKPALANSMTLIRCFYLLKIEEGQICHWRHKACV
jgi:hypothetical protein